MKGTADVDFNLSVFSSLMSPCKLMIWHPVLYISLISSINVSPPLRDGSPVRELIKSIQNIGLQGRGPTGVGNIAKWGLEDTSCQLVTWQPSDSPFKAVGIWAWKVIPWRCGRAKGSFWKKLYLEAFILHWYRGSENLAGEWAPTPFFLKLFEMVTAALGLSY